MKRRQILDAISAVLIALILFALAEDHGLACGNPLLIGCPNVIDDAVEPTAGFTWDALVP